ncbi:MAG: hypothetical protein GY915_04310 [bacterium]|nr:hypothetical protein [bacterium]
MNRLKDYCDKLVLNGDAVKSDKYQFFLGVAHEWYECGGRRFPSWFSIAVFPDDLRLLDCEEGEMILIKVENESL